MKQYCCSNCDKQIFKKDNIYKVYKKNADYRERIIVFSNGQKMLVGLCKECLENFNDDIAQNILISHKEHWTNSILEDAKLSSIAKKAKIDIINDLELCQRIQQ